MTYSVKEIFLTLQGEGGQLEEPAAYVQRVNRLLVG